jgi:hypothetical protein
MGSADLGERLGGFQKELNGKFTYASYIGDNINAPEYAQSKLPQGTKLSPVNHIYLWNTTVKAPGVTAT